MTVAHWQPKPDPPLRRNRVCACGCGKALTPVGIKERDPFATTDCCKRFHGVSIAIPKTGVPVGASA